MYHIVDAIKRRLTTARANAGLSQRQTDRLLELPDGTIKSFEEGTFEISLYAFLVLCNAYGVSPTWALTGVNPYVDVGEIVRLTQNTKIARDDLDKILELLNTLPSPEEFGAISQED